MKICKVENLKGNETLAKTIITKDFQILLSEGTALKPDYIQKLLELDIEEVYVKEEKTEAIEILKAEIEEIFTVKVKEILERHTYQHNEHLIELNNTAEKIIKEIISDKRVVEQVFDLKERSSDLYEHSISLCSLATLTAIKLELSRESIHSIGVGSLLHDIGLRYLTISYNNQDLSHLTPEETAEYKKHTVYGYSSLKNEDWISPIAKNILLYHHERLDGTGYPLKATEIPYECQIVNVCDSFDEMICGIGCKRVKVYEAVEYLKVFKNIKFNDKIVDTFLDFIAVYPAGSYVITNEGEMGVVIRQNKEFPNRPILQMIEDKDGNKYKDDIIKNLINEKHVFIVKVND